MFEITEEEVAILNAARDVCKALDRRSGLDGFDGPQPSQQSIGRFQETAIHAEAAIFRVLNVAKNHCYVPLTDKEVQNRKDDWGGNVVCRDELDLFAGLELHADVSQVKWDRGSYWYDPPLRLYDEEDATATLLVYCGNHVGINIVAPAADSFEEMERRVILHFGLDAHIDDNWKVEEVRES